MLNIRTLSSFDCHVRLQGKPNGYLDFARNISLHNIKHLTAHSLRAGRGNSQELTQFSPDLMQDILRVKGQHKARHHQRHPQRYKVNSHFQCRWSPAKLTLNNYFTYFQFLYLTRITNHNHTPHQKLLYTKPEEPSWNVK